MLLSDILEDADLLAPNAFSTNQKLRMLNQAQRQLFRDFPLGDTVYSTTLTTGVDTFTPPVDCSMEQIFILLVGGKEYVYKNPAEITDRSTYSIVDGKIIVFPVPSQSTAVKLHYNKALADLTAADLDTPPAFPVDYHELLVYGVAARIALRGRDFETASQLEGRLHILSAEARLNITKPKLRRTVVSRNWL